MGKYEENLIGKTTHLMEVDDEEDTSVYDAEIFADTTELVDNINKEEFKYLYQNLYNEIMNMEIKDKRLFCEKLSDKIYDVYNFEFSPKLDFNDENEVNNFLKFVEFLEFDYIDQLALIINGLDMIKLRRDLDLFFKEYAEDIIIRIDFLLRVEKFFGLISNFFRTNTKNGIIDFMKSRFERDKMIIILKTMEGEITNE